MHLSTQSKYQEIFKQIMEKGRSIIISEDVETIQKPEKQRNPFLDKIRTKYVIIILL